jgi:Rrf2 family iron-sulfur cluster assembly transcriptional regulator
VKLSTQADYAVRAVYELARLAPGTLVHTRTIAAAQGIPEGYLAKVIQELVRAGVVRTFRGKQGGVLLARPASEISVREVCEAIEGPVLLCRCRQRAEPCGDEPCDTHDFWFSVESLLTMELENVSFAALAGPKPNRGAQAAGTAARR